MKINFEDLGFTKDQIADRVVDQICDTMLREEFWHPEYEEQCDKPSKFQQLINKKIEDRLNEAVDNLAKKHTLPKMEKLLEGFVIKRTNQWGEATGKSMTFIEHLTHQAEHWFEEPVDLNGKTKKEAGNFSWNKSTTRGAHMVDQHLKYSIDRALEGAFKDINGQIAGGLEEAVKISLSGVLSKIKVSTNLGR